MSPNKTCFCGYTNIHIYIYASLYIYIYFLDSESQDIKKIYIKHTLFSNIAGRWYTYPSEKYEFVNWNDDIPNIWNIIHSCSSHHQPDIYVYINPNKSPFPMVYKSYINPNKSP